MPPSVKTKNLKFETILFDFIEPIVLLYKAGKSYFIASALPSEFGYVKEYLVVSVTPKFLKRYFREENDLRFLFVSAPHRSFWKMPASEVGKDTAKVKEFSGSITEDMLPDAQFFSSSHTHSYQTMANTYSALETLFIDGNWEMEDFGSFSRKYRDLYAFEESINKLSASTTSVSLKNKIGKAFNGHTLQGGGSYVGLFRELLNSLPKEERYDLKRVEYASPGRIELQGKGAVFDALEERIKNMVSNSQALHDTYVKLRQFMSETNLLNISTPVITVSQTTKDRLEVDTRALFSALGLDLYDTIFRLTGGNVVSTAKISMAIYRRVKQAASYFSEGRIAYER
ncbi:hypothetical protein [Celeribacter halophilus]|uniref:Uncharacterized protein n=1 Tax=Celeribacter halophilus TaxID=576117 RepID=A0A1I3UL86_9RHOB|nr:hypothetical protein [Celeribacter halophilus]PZX10088.1 hypothetical protein LX82_02649 [Celeribacter halophilus]SFJ84268.1 hypothetical protein SAMN04488138_1123 [Celeribacter halophilus]